MAGIFYPGGRAPSSGTGRETVLLSGSPFSTLAALETYSQANPTELLNNPTQVALAVVTTDPTASNNGTYEWSGANMTYASGRWVKFSGLDAADIKSLYESNSNTNAFTDDDNSTVSSAQNLTQNAIPMAGPSGTVMDSIAVQSGLSGINIDGNLGTSKDTINVGGGMSLSEDGTLVKVRDNLESRSLLLVGTLLNSDGSTGNTVTVSRTSPVNQVVQGVLSESNTGNLTAWFPITSTRIINNFTTRFGAAATKIRLTLRDSPDQSTTSGVILYQSHTDAEFAAGNGFTVANENKTFTLPNASKLVSGRFVYLVAEQHSTGTGTLTILGSNTTIGGVEQFYPYLEQSTQEETEVQLSAGASDIINDNSIANDKAWSAQKLANENAIGVFFNGRNGQTYNMSAGEIVASVGTDNYNTGGIDYLDLAHEQGDSAEYLLPVGILTEALDADSQKLKVVLHKGNTTVTIPGQDDLPLDTPFYVTRTGTGQNEQWSFTHDGSGDNTYFVGRLHNDAGTNQYHAWVDFSLVWSHQFDQSVDDTIKAKNDNTDVSGKFDTLNFVGQNINATVNPSNSSQLDIEVNPTSTEAHNGTGASVFIGQGVQPTADTNGNLVMGVIDGSEGELPTVWAGFEIASNAAGIFISEGVIEGVEILNSSGANRRLTPATVGDSIYWDIARELFTLSPNNRENPRCGAIKASSYVLDVETFFNAALSLGSATISNAETANAARNSTIITPSNTPNNATFQIPNLQIDQEYTTPFLVGDRIAFLNTTTSSNLNVIIQPNGLFQDINGGSITTYSVSAGGSVVVERINGDIWKVVLVNDGIITSDLVVSNQILQSDLISTVEQAVIPLQNNVTEAMKGFLSGGEFARTSNSQVTINSIIARSDDNTETMQTTSSTFINMPADLDQGSETASTWYYIWMFKRNSDDAIAFRFSTSNTNPLMPSGFNVKRLVGAVYNDSSSNFRGFRAYGDARRKIYVYDSEFLSLSNQSYTTRTLINISSVVPAMPLGRPLCDVTLEWSGGNLLVYNDDKTSTRAFGPAGGAIMTVTNLVLTASGQFGLGGSGGGATGVYLKISSFNMEL